MSNDLGLDKNDICQRRVCVNCGNAYSIADFISSSSHYFPSPYDYASAALADGRAMDSYRAMIAAQGGDLDAALPESRHRELVTASATGWLRGLDARAVGVAAWRLGAGRARKEDQVSAAAGVICLAKPGDRVDAGRRCSSCAATIRPGSAGPGKRWQAWSRSARSRPSPLTPCLAGSA